MSHASNYKRATVWERRLPHIEHFVAGAKVKRGHIMPPTSRVWRLRVRLIEFVILRVICPLAGRPIQLLRQDERSGGLHHAPACGANHYHHTRPITTACTCGALATQHEDTK